MIEEPNEFKVTDRRGAAKERPVDVIKETPKKESKKGVKSSPMFSNLIMSVSTSALMYLGAIPDPQTGQTHLNVDAAKQQVDLLLMFKEKTEGNLSDEENRLLDEILYELQMRFVKLSKLPPPPKNG